MEKAVNAQINAELWSARLYLSISVALAARCYHGLAARMRSLHRNSLERAYRFIDYLIRQGGQVVLTDTTDVPVMFDGPVEACEYALVHTLRMTELIDTLSATAVEENDRVTSDLLAAFASRQVEEESALSVLVTRLKRLQDEPGISWLDMMIERQECGKVTK